MLVHWIWFSQCSLSDWAKGKLLQHFADPEEIYYAEASALSAVDGVTAENIAALSDKDLKRPEEVLQECHRKEVHILTVQDAAYPNRLKHIPDPPAVLYYKGMLPDWDAVPVIGVVGTRKASAYGMQAAKQLGYQISCGGGIVVSGLACGIDSMAMTGALAGGQSTVGVLGCGIDIVYPRSNQTLFQQTLRYGCILSEYAPGVPPAKWTFPRRNRIISGLSNGVLVVEAPQKSGALITAKAALEQGRDVFVVPGNIDMPTCAGSNRLMRDGAIPVSCGWDILSEYETEYSDKIRNIQDKPPVSAAEEIPGTGGKKTLHGAENMASAPNEKNLKNENDKKVIDNGHSSLYSDVNDILPRLSEEERIVVSALKDGQRLVDDVIAQTGLTTGKVLGLLTILELKNVIVRHPGKRISLK